MKVYIVQDTSMKQSDQSVTFDDGRLWHLSMVKERLMSMGFGVGRLFRLVHGKSVFYSEDEYDKKYRGKCLYYHVPSDREVVLDDVYEAILLNDEDKLRQLIPAIFCINVKSAKYDTPIKYAFSKDRLEMFQLLIESGADISQSSKEEIPLIHRAIVRDNISYVRLLIRYGADPNQRGAYGQTPLMLTESVPMMAYLLENGADINIAGNSGRTALHKAVESKKADLAQFLMSKGADPNRRDMYGRTALMVAECIPMITHLLENGAKINSTDDRGWGILHRVAGSKSTELIQFLISKGANPNMQSLCGVTPLMMTKNISTMTCLLENGADINMVDIGGRNVLYRYTNVERENEELIRYLLSKGIDVNTGDIHGYTPLMIAARQGKMNIVRLLLEYEANKFARDIDGQTAEQIARLNGHNEVASLIRDYEFNLIKEPEWDEVEWG